MKKGWPSFSSDQYYSIPGPVRVKREYVVRKGYIFPNNAILDKRNNKDGRNALTR